MDKNRKLFVLDTNVILHDSSCIYRFSEHDVVVPITVLEELDHFKKGNDSLSFHAREFLRILDSLSGDTLFEEGILRGKDQGRILVKLEQKFHKALALNFSPNKIDHHILNTAYHLSLLHPSRQVILVSKDVNLRMKAKSVGIKAQDYRNDHIKDPSALYKGHRLMENVSDEIMNKLLLNIEQKVMINEFPESEHFIPNEYLIVRNDNKSALVTYDPYEQIIQRIKTEIAVGIKPRNAEQTFTLNALLNPKIHLITISGKAGTGKTLMALAGAIQSQNSYRQLLIARPIIPLSNNGIGYLPGSINDKIDPFMQPIYDNLGVIEDQQTQLGKEDCIVKDLLKNKKLVVTPLSYIRGRSLVKVYFIIDEAQNLTPHEVKTIITRAGEGTKIVFTGDILQIDHPYLNTYSNGLSYLIDKMQGQSIFAHINLERGERSKLAELASDLL